MVTMLMIEDPPDGCSIEVVGMPVAAMGHHRLDIGDEDDLELRPVVHLRTPTTPTRLRVVGPRYRGQRIVEPEQCRPDTTLRLEAEPLPATLAFPCAPEGLTVTCQGCPGLDEDQPHLGTDVPAVPMSSSYLDVELLLRAPNHRRRTIEVRLHPGPNVLRVKLEPL